MIFRGALLFFIGLLLGTHLVLSDMEEKLDRVQKREIRKSQFLQTCPNEFEQEPFPMPKKTENLIRL